MDVLFRIVVEDAGVKSALQTNSALVKQLNKDLKGVNEGTVEYVKLSQQLVTAKVEATNLRDRQRELNREFKQTQVPTDSLAGLRLEYSKLTAQIANLSRAERESNFGKNLVQNANGIKKEIDGIEQSVGRFTGNVGNYGSAITSFAKNALGPLAALAAAQKIIGNNAAISDQVADVAKAADISIDSVNRLADTLEKRLTRTSLADQLGIAEIGGKLGVAEKDLFSFVEAIDVVNVALGDQFGGSVETTTDVLGKLRNVLTDIKSDNIGKDIQNIGNALNFLEAQGAASAGVIADFAGRIAGAGRNLGVTSGQIIGVSATLDELGVNAERGASAYVRILQRVAGSPAEFAKAAKVSSEDFTELVNTDIAGAVNLFLSKINDQNLSNTELQKVLKGLKLGGVGTAETVGKLGQNMELLNRRTTEAGKALQSTDSIQQEFEKKNQTLGASIERLTNLFVNLTTDSGFARFLGGIIDQVTDLISIFQSENDVIQDQRESFNALIGVIQDTAVSERDRAKAVDELKKQYPEYLRYVNDEVGGQIDLNATLQAGNELFAKRAFLQSVQRKLDDATDRQIKADQDIIPALEEQSRLRRTGQGGQRAGLIRNEAADQTQGVTAQRVADERVKGILAVRDQADKEIAEILRLANEVSLRTFRKSFDDLRGKVDDINLSGETNNEPGTGTAAPDIGKKSKQKDKEKAGDAGSLEDLRDRIQKLNKEIEKSPNDIRILDPLILKLRQTEFLLSELESRIDNIKNPKIPISEDQNILNELAGGALPQRSDISLSQRERNINFQDNSAFEQEEENKRKLDELDNIYDKRKGERDEKRKKKREEIEKYIFDIASQSIAAVAQIRQTAIARDEQKQLDAIDAEYQERIDRAGNNAVLVSQLEKEQAKKREEIEKEAAQRKKATAKTEAIIQGAVSFVEALPNLALAFFTAAQTALQVALIDSQEFAVGGFTGPGGERDYTGQRVAGSYMKGNTRIVYHDGEYIAPKSQVRQYPALFQMLEGDRIQKNRSFAQGGFTDFVPQLPGVGPIQQQQTIIVSGFTEDQERRIAETIAREVARQTGEKVKEGAALGLADANRLRERQALANERRTI